LLFDAIIVVDAWEMVYPAQWAEDEDPHLKKEVDDFCLIINEMLRIERKRGTLIIHQGGHSKTYYDERIRQTINKNIDVFFSDEVTQNTAQQEHLNIKYKLENVVLCGFHLGRCIDHYYERLVEMNANYYICKNMSQVYLGDVYENRPGTKYCNWNGFNFEVEE
jgi:hypothetical protein